MEEMMLVRFGAGNTVCVYKAGSRCIMSEVRDDAAGSVHTRWHWMDDAARGSSSSSSSSSCHPANVDRGRAPRGPAPCAP